MRYTAYFALLCAACSGESMVSSTVDVTLAGLQAHGTQVVRRCATGGALVQRELKLAQAPNDGVLLLAELDADGFVRTASFRREGALGKRYVELRASSLTVGARELLSRGNDERVAVGPGHFALLQLADMVRPSAAALTTGTIDIVRAAVLLSTAPPPLATDAPLPRHREREPFIESTAPIVVSWCKQQSQSTDALVAARQIEQALSPRLAPDRAHGPPSALNTVRVGGYDAGGAALEVACLRAIGHAARVVQGDADGAPRTWAQVYDGVRFVDVDALGAAVHNASVEGLP